MTGVRDEAGEKSEEALRALSSHHDISSSSVKVNPQEHAC